MGMEQHKADTEDKKKKNNSNTDLESEQRI